MDRDALVDLIGRDYTVQRIALALGKSYTTTRYWLDKYELSTHLGPHGKGRRALLRKCSCGETDPAKFYGRKRTVCRECHLRYVLQRGHEARIFAINTLGGVCKNCGFDKYKAALDCHHVDPNLKDPAFNSMRGWSGARLEEEIKKCVLLCKNCHAAAHAGELVLNTFSSPTTPTNLT